MKTKLVTTLLCASLISSSMAGDAWDITRNTLYTNKPSHVWENLNGSKTYRTDSPGRTTYDTRSAESVASEAQFKQDLALLAAGAVIAGAMALYEWVSTSLSSSTSSNR